MTHSRQEVEGKVEMYFEKKETYIQGKKDCIDKKGKGEMYSVNPLFNPIRLLVLLFLCGVLFLSSWLFGEDSAEYPRPFANLCILAMCPLVMMLSAAFLGRANLHKSFPLFVIVVSCGVFIPKFIDIVCDIDNGVWVTWDFIKLAYGVGVFLMGLTSGIVSLSKRFWWKVSAMFTLLLAIIGFFALKSYGYSLMGD